MYRIKRTKTPLPPASGGDAVHYATEISARGNVTGWTPTVALAGLFSASEAEKAKAFYAGRRNVGTLDFQDMTPVPEVAVLPEPIKDVEPVKSVEWIEPAVESKPTKAVGHKPRHKHQGE